jgi:hypothetical protein
LELTKYKNHRDPKYLNWLRQQNCVVSELKAQCAHHVRLKTNGGCSLKPSDYFCIPLTNDSHTTGSNALHIIGEETFIAQHSLDCIELFSFYLKKYLLEQFDFYYMLKHESSLELLANLISIIEVKSTPNIVRSKPISAAKKPALKDDYYQKSKKLKNEYDKELRKKLKQHKSLQPQKKSEDDEFYQIAKELKRNQQKVLRAKAKETMKITPLKKSPEQLLKLEQAKQLRREQEKAYRIEQKKRHAKYLKEQNC